MSASQAAAKRPSGELGPAGAGASCSELHSERSAEPGSCGSSRRTQPTASARKPAYAEPRHSAMGTDAPHRRPAPFPARASSVSARADVDTLHVTPARRSPRGAGWGRGSAPLPGSQSWRWGARLHGPGGGGTKARRRSRARALGLQPDPSSRTTEQADYEEAGQSHANL